MKDTEQPPARFPLPRVVALRYDDAVEAPRVVAKGRGSLADRILAVAEENEIPVRQDADLLELLTVCELGEEIPTELYSAIAQLLAYLYRLNGAGMDQAARPNPADANRRGGVH